MPSTCSSDIKLSNGITVSQYRKLERAQDRVAIACFIEKRFKERYLLPLTIDTNRKSGFTIIAISCLMIEALETFSLGWKNSKNHSEEVFISFFDRWPSFKVFRDDARGFYKNIRCGILHQAETTGGWRIHRKGPLLDQEHRTINATKFLHELGIVLEEYCDKLKSEPWTSACWKSFRKKMNSVCRNCEIPD